MATTLLDEPTADLPHTAGSDLDIIVASRQDATLTTVREWVQSGAAWSECSGCLQSCGVGGCRSGICRWTQRADCGVAGAPPARSSQLVVPIRDQDMIH